MDSVLTALDELEEILEDVSLDNLVIDNKVASEHSSSEIEYNQLNIKVSKLEKEQEYQKKKNEQLEIILQAQESLLKGKNEEILDLTDNIKQTKEDNTQYYKDMLIKKEEEVKNLSKSLEGKIEQIKLTEKCVENLQSQVEEIKLIKIIAEESCKEIKGKDDKIKELQLVIEKKDK